MTTLLMARQLASSACIISASLVLSSEAVSQEASLPGNRNVGMGLALALALLALSQII